MDVARKVVILARGCGLQTELAQLEVESLVPEALREAGAADFMRRLPEVGGVPRVHLATRCCGGWRGLTQGNPPILHLPNPNADPHPSPHPRSTPPPHTHGNAPAAHCATPPPPRCQYDAQMAARADAAAAAGAVLRYVGVVDVAAGAASVTLQRWAGCRLGGGQARCEWGERRGRAGWALAQGGPRRSREPSPAQPAAWLAPPRLCCPASLTGPSRHTLRLPPPTPTLSPTPYPAPPQKAFLRTTPLPRSGAATIS
jgi:hypothetical protein